METPDKAHRVGKRIKAELNDELDKILIELKVRGEYVDYDQIEALYDFSRKLVLHEPWRSHLVFADFMYVIGAAIRRHKAKTASFQEAKLVSQVLGSVAFEVFRKDVHSYLRSIPRNYELWIELPVMRTWGEGSLALSSRIRLVEAGKGHEKKGMLAQMLASSKSPVSLVISTSGFGSNRLHTTAVVDAISHAKQFLQIFRRTDVYREATPPVEEVFAFSGSTGASLKDLQDDSTIDLQLPVGLARVVATLSIDTQKLEYLEDPPPKGRASTVLTREFRPPEDRVEFSEAMTQKLGWIRRLLDCPASWPDAARIRSAFEWAFDSQENDNETFAFIQTCIGLESLLGDDSEDEPLVARLADRCAYLLGQGHSDRGDIRRRFKAMYKIRSKVVHGRSPRLSPSDARELHNAQQLLGQVISEESGRLLKALGKQKST